MELGTPPIPPPTTPGGGGRGPFPGAGMLRAMSSSRRSLMHSPSNLWDVVGVGCNVWGMRTHSLRVFACCDSSSYRLCLIRAISWICACTVEDEC